MKDTVIWNIEQGARLSGPQVGAAEVKRTALYHRMREFMRRYDYLVAPGGAGAALRCRGPSPPASTTCRAHTYLDWMRSCYYITVTGAPAISVPCGFSGTGLPVGLQIIGRHREDFGVLQMAHAFEQATGYWKRRPPIA